MPYISEIHFLTPDAATEPEYIEIVLDAGEDPQDYVVSLYDHTGALKTDQPARDPNAGTQTNVATNGEIRLSDLVGVSNPEDPTQTIYLIGATSGTNNRLLNGGATESLPEANYVSLYDTNTGSLVSAYGIGVNPSTTLTGGVADGALASVTGVWPGPGESYHFSRSGTLTSQSRSPNSAVTCFEKDTIIATAKGSMPVYRLCVGDLVQTLDDGLQPVLWIGRTATSIGEVANMAPIRISAGALGPGQPKRDLTVSRQHRVLVDLDADKYGTGILVPACKLTFWPGIFEAKVPRAVTYYHFLLPRHGLVLSNGAWTESLFPGPQAFAALSSGQRAALRACLPTNMAYPAARPIVERRAQFHAYLDRAQIPASRLSGSVPVPESC